MDIETKTFNSSLSKFTSKAICLFIMFFRSIILARLLDVETFGVYTFCFHCVSFFLIFTDFGITEAFLNEKELTNENTAVHFTLKFTLAIIWFVLFSIIVIAFVKDTHQNIFLILITFLTINEINRTQITILQKNIELSFLARVELISTILSTILAFYLAFYGFEISVLLSIFVVESLILTFAIQIYSSWKIKICWTKTIIKTYFNYGFKIYTLSLLENTIQKFDKIFINLYIGETELGHYATAQRIADYPKLLFNMSINMVVYGVYGNLRTDQKQLSSMFSQISTLLVRSSLLVTGCIISIVPEFIILTMGSKWEPSLNVIPFMLICVNLEIWKKNILNMLKSTNTLRIIVLSQIIQLVFIFLLISSLYSLGNLGNVSVAASITVSFAIKFVILTYCTRNHLSCSITKVFLAPCFAASIALIISLSMIGYYDIHLQNSIMRMLIFVVIYNSLLLYFEKNIYMSFLSHIKKSLSRRSE